MQNEAKLREGMGARGQAMGAAQDQLYKRSQLGAACLALSERPASGSSRPSRPDWLRLTQQARRSRRTAPIGFVWRDAHATGEAEGPGGNRAKRSQWAGKDSAIGRGALFPFFLPCRRLHWRFSQATLGLWFGVDRS